MAVGNMFNKRRSVTRNPMASAKAPYRMSPDFWYEGEQRPNLQTAAVRTPQANPIAPATRESTLNQDFFRGNPLATSSTGTAGIARNRTLNNAAQSSMANAYSNPIDAGLDMRSLDDRERLARGNAAYLMSGGPAADPTNLAGRFGGTSPMLSDSQRRAQDYATSQAAMAERMRTQMPTDRAQNVFVKPSSSGQGLAYTDRLQALRNTPMDTPGRADAIAMQEADRKTAGQRMAQQLSDYKAAHGGLNAHGVRRQQLQDRRAQNKYNDAVTAGMNPMSPQAQSLFPAQTQKFMEQRRSSMGVQNPMGSSAPERTMAGQQQSAVKIAELAAVDPALTGLGVKPEQGMVGLHTALGARLDEDPNLSLADSELKSYQTYAREMANLSTDQNNQFNFGNSPFDKYSGDLWRELGQLPDNQRVREEWLTRFKNRKNAITGAATAVPSAGQYFMGGPVGR